MRVTPQNFFRTLGLTAWGVMMLTGLGGCGQLWRPFLDPTGCASGAACSDFALIVDAGADLSAIPVDMSAAPWPVEPSGTTQTLNGIWGIDSTSTLTDGGVATGTTLHTQLWAVGDGGTIVTRDSTDGTWTRQAAVRTTSTFFAVSGHGIADVLAVGELQTAAAWNGYSWTTSLPADMGAAVPFLGAAAIDSGYLLVGQSNTIVLYNFGRRTTPSGYAYSTQSDLTSIYYQPASAVSYIGISSGEILKHAGTEYTPVALKAAGAIQSVWARNTADVWAVGDGGIIMHYRVPAERNQPPDDPQRGEALANQGFRCGSKCGLRGDVKDLYAMDV